MSDQEPTDDEVVKAVYSFAATHLKNGTSPIRIQSMLVEKGLSDEVAQTVVSGLVEARSEAIREAGKKEMRNGGLWCVGGILVTAISYGAGGGRFFFAWGAIIFGAIQFFRGLSKSNEA
jgi:hypothetical protein